MHLTGTLAILAVLLFTGFSGSQLASAGIPSGECEDGTTTPPTGASAGDPQSTPQCVPQSTNTWLVGDDTNRIPIGHQPGAGPWIKQLQHSGFNFQEMDNIEEFLVVGQGSHWTDWHEVIVFPVTWQMDVISVVATLPNNDIVNGIPKPNQPSNQVWIDFPVPLPPGTEVDIVKKLTCTDQNGCQVNVIEMWQYPTIDTRTKVGGQMINVDSTALILAGGQMTAAWILPVIVAGAGFAIVIARKF